MSRIDYSSWLKLSLSISNLRLDKNNPRIPYYIPTKTTKDILSYLFEQENIENLAENIVDKGFINHEPIYVTKENDYYVVIEGNRRISALKCLLNPSQAPSVKLTRKFEKLKNKLGNDLIDKVEVYVASSRIDAQNVLFELHAEGKLQWNRQQKNNFIVDAGATSGESIEEIAARFNVKPSEIQDSVQEYYLNRYFTELGLPTDIEEKALNTNFSLTNLSRLVNTNLFKQITGFKINDGKLQTQISKNKFNYLISYFVKDIIDKIVVTSLDDDRFYLDINKHTPVLFFDRYIKNTSLPFITSESICSVAELISSQTKQLDEFYFIGCDLQLTTINSRLEGFKQGLSKAGLKLNDDWIISADYRENRGYELIKQVHRKLGRLPKAIFTPSCNILQEILSYLVEINAKQKDIYLCSYDHNIYFDYICYPIDAIAQDYASMAKACVDTTNKLINFKPLKNRTIFIKPQIVWDSKQQGS
ncbi:substrate-binding domain-containing protein [Orbaceae bacterium ESL0727]|nr:substrate-binding domain-containing protein [Orbaceae bacterium ESL0727]